MPIRTTASLALLLVGLAAAPASAQAPLPAPGYGAAAQCPANAFPQYGPQGPGCYRVVERSRRHPALFWPGFSAFVASYAFTVVYGVFQLDSGHPDGVHSLGTSLIPVAGPFVAMAFEEQEADLGMLGAFGGIQAIGLTLMILSHAVPQRVEGLQRVTFTGNGVAGVF